MAQERIKLSGIEDLLIRFHDWGFLWEELSLNLTRLCRGVGEPLDTHKIMLDEELIGVDFELPNGGELQWRLMTDPNPFAAISSNERARPFIDTRKTDRPKEDDDELQRLLYACLSHRQIVRMVDQVLLSQGAILEGFMLNEPQNLFNSVMDALTPDESKPHSQIRWLAILPQLAEFIYVMPAQSGLHVKAY